VASSVEKAVKWFPIATLVLILYVAFTGAVAVPLAEVNWGVGKEASCCSVFFLSLPLSIRWRHDSGSFPR
jgi:hypothetical protein